MSTIEFQLGATPIHSRRSSPPPPLLCCSRKTLFHQTCQKIKTHIRRKDQRIGIQAQPSSQDKKGGKLQHFFPQNFSTERVFSCPRQNVPHRANGFVFVFGRHIDHDRRVRGGVLASVVGSSNKSRDMSIHSTVKHRLVLSYLPRERRSQQLCQHTVAPRHMALVAANLKAISE